MKLTWTDGKQRRTCWIFQLCADVLHAGCEWIHQGAALNLQIWLCSAASLRMWRGDKHHRRRLKASQCSREPDTQLVSHLAARDNMSVEEKLQTQNKWVLWFGQRSFSKHLWFWMKPVAQVEINKMFSVQEKSGTFVWIKQLFRRQKIKFRLFRGVLSSSVTGREDGTVLTWELLFTCRWRQESNLDRVWVKPERFTDLKVVRDGWRTEHHLRSHDGLRQRRTDLLLLMKVMNVRNVVYSVAAPVFQVFKQNVSTERGWLNVVKMYFYLKMREEKLRTDRCAETDRCGEKFPGVSPGGGGKAAAAASSSGDTRWGRGGSEEH